MLTALIWPFDWSCSGFTFLMLFLGAWFVWSVAAAAKKAAQTAKKVMQSDTAKKVGKNVIEAWIVSWFHR